MSIKSIESQNSQNNVQTERSVTLKKKIYTLHELNLKCKLKKFYYYFTRGIFTICNLILAFMNSFSFLMYCRWC